MESYVFGKESFHARTISHESVIRAPRNIQALVWEQKQPCVRLLQFLDALASLKPH